MELRMGDICEVHSSTYVAVPAGDVAAGGMVGLIHIPVGTLFFVHEVRSTKYTKMVHGLTPDGRYLQTNIHFLRRIDS
jgi:hypothetical protein